MFGTQNKKNTTKADKKSEVAQRYPLEDVLRNPRITEKASRLTGQKVYTFDVSPRATKIDVKRAVSHVYGVTPVKVRMIAVPKEQVFSRRTRTKGVKGGGKKALVHLKKNDSIEFV